MIARLVGTVVAREGNRAVLDVRDVGYAVTGPQRDVDAWATADGPVTVWVHTDVREDAITLYGFSEDLDRVAFERLRAVNGVGPKVALGALDTLGLTGLVAAVEQDDTRALSRISGVGKKLASRMALELKGKLPASFTPTASTPAPAQAPPADDPLKLALDKLGYGRAEIARAQAGLAAQGLADASLTDRLKAALRLLSGG